jgi:hypothetical protein
MWVWPSGPSVFPSRIRGGLPMHGIRAIGNLSDIPERATAFPRRPYPVQEKHMSPTETTRRARSSDRSDRRSQHGESRTDSQSSNGPAVEPEFRDAWAKAVNDFSERSRAS